MKKMFALLFAAALALSLTACDKDSTPQKPQNNPPTASTPADSSPAPNDITTTPPAPDTTAPSANDTITEERAKELALAHAGVTAQDVSFFEIELDRNDKGALLYEIEFRAGNDKYEYDINAKTGAILEAEKNDKNILETTYKKIEEAKAKEIALNHAGLTENAITHYKIEFDVDDGVPSYEIEFRSGGYEYEYDIDAVSGKILKSEKEIDD